MAKHKRNEALVLSESGVEGDGDLFDAVASCQHDPLKWSLLAYPWQKEGTPLETFKGPDKWQVELFHELGVRLRRGERLKDFEPIRFARAAAHGVGKSSAVSMLCDWALSTFVDTRGIVTANTEKQLRTKTWPELGKWRRMSITKAWFLTTATACYSTSASRRDSWRVDAIPWSEERPESFAGLHNLGRRTVLFFDEASAIHDIIWETAEGALTDKATEIMWFAFGNPTRNTGRFYDCFNSAKYWLSRQLSGFDCAFTNKKLLQQWVDEYGADSDFVRVRALGQFPHASSAQFISRRVVDEAVDRRLSVNEYAHHPLIAGVDIARFGTDKSVIVLRQGKKLIEIWKYSGLDGIEVAGRALQIYRQYPTITRFMVDGIGVGAAAVDPMTRFAMPITDVNVGTAAKDDKQYFNLRTEMWGLMRDWLRTADISILKDDMDARHALTTPEYGFNDRLQIRLESKDTMRSRGEDSPDEADAIALTFVEDAARPNFQRLRQKRGVQKRIWSSVA